MGLTERHLFENEDVPENYERELEEAVYNSRINEKPETFIKIPYYGCGCDFESQKYKEDCYFYGETHDMGATIRYCTRKEIKWGDCPCENCNNFLSKSEADKIVRRSLLEQGI